MTTTTISTRRNGTRLLWTSEQLTSFPDLKWLWQNWLPESELVMLAGKQGSAKSTLALQLSRAIAEGRQFPDGSSATRGRVLYFDLEGSPQAAGKRFRELGMKSHSIRCCFLESVPEQASRLAFFLKLVRNGRCKLAIVDSYRGLDVGDERRADVARATLDRLKTTAQEYGTTILLIHHLNKQSSVKDELDRVAGSSDLTARPRVVWLLKREATLRVLKMGKSNLGPEPLPIRFEMSDGRLVPREIEETVSEVDRACEFLRNELTSGPRSSQELYQAATLEGISRRTLERAKSTLLVSSEKRGSSWTWRR